MTKLSVKVKRLKQGAQLPAYETAGSAGMDIRACLEEPLVLERGGRARIPTGLAFEIPEGFEAQIRPRSGLALKNGITVLNAPGTIDSDYRGELSIILINLSEKSETIRNGDRIAQIIFAPLARALLEETAALSETERGEGGFGSTGR
ncbi:MAG: dUTP diphosphatase [Spirochaetaceae bacterium]|jgi:dUTP pyrophosphatase|nr:dUTP diphosphatase [Spirochaetaceae bacterium]